MTHSLSELERVFQRALEKFRVGEAKHGPFVPEEDGRDLPAESEAEILDAINYLAMHLVKTRKMRGGGCGKQCACSKGS